MSQAYTKYLSNYASMSLTQTYTVFHYYTYNQREHTYDAGNR